MDDTPKNSFTGAKSGTSAHERVTLGFLLASLHTGASLTIWPSLLDAARRHDVNLICFPGGRLHAAEAFEIQRNVIFELASDAYLDGLISWSSSLGGVLGPAEIKAFHERYHPLPMVSLAQLMEGTPTVSLDSYLGMRALLSHLIEEHGYRRLAFIRGPEEHYYAQERYRAYLDALQAYNLPLAAELVTRPLPWESGTEAIQILLDERHLQPGKDFQAVVAVSDMLALWALKTLQSRGFRVPDDVAVTGFNNSIEERLATPPLTTVELPFYEQGAKAMDVLLQQLSGEPVPALITLPSKLVVRQSCGCPSAAVAQAAYSPADEQAPPQDGIRLEDRRADCLSEMAAAAGLAPAEAAAWLDQVFEAFIHDLESLSAAKPPRQFLPALDSVLDQAMRASHDIEPWQDAISTLRRRALPSLSYSERVRAEALFSQARVVIGEALQRSHAYWQWRANREAENLREINRSLLTTFDMQQLAGVLVERLPDLGIPSVFLVLYEPAAQEQPAAEGGQRTPKQPETEV